MFAVGCGQFTEGDGVYVDCDREELKPDNDDVNVKWSSYSTEYVTGYMIEAII